MSIFSCHRDSVKLSGRIAGDEAASESALLIHGLNTNMAFWHPLLVRALGEKRRLLLYDQRGHGYSDLAPSGYTCGELAEDAVAILDHCEASVVDVVAHSFGAGVALQLARQHPERIRRVTILDGRLRCVQPDVRLGDWSCFPRWAEHFAKGGVHLDPTWELDCTLPLRLENLDLSQIDERLAADGFFVSVYSKRAMTKYRRLISETSALADFRNPEDFTREDLNLIGCPVSLIYGSISPFLATGECLSEDLDSPLEIINDVGHNFPFNFPQRTFDAMVRIGAWPEQIVSHRSSEV